MEKKSFLHNLFGTTPGKGVQPKEALAYSITGIGQNFICTMVGSFITLFMTDALLFGADGVTVGHIEGTIAVAILMLAARVFDAFNDPIMGSVVDKTRTKWGKCRPYLKWMAIPIAISTILCFLPIFKAENVLDGTKAVQTFATIAVIYVMWSVLYTIADVPYWGLSTCLTNDTNVRGNILTVARMACTVGAGVVTVFLPIISGALTKEFKYTELDIEAIKIDKSDAISNMLSSGAYKSADAAAATFIDTVKSGSEMLNADKLKWIYFVAAVVLVILAIPMFFYGFKNTKERFTSDENPPSFGHNIKLLFKNKQLLLIVLSGILGGARMVYTYTGGMYFAKYILKDEGLFSTITLLVVPGGLIASILVPWMTKKFTKKWSYIVVHLFGGLVMAAMFFVGYEETWQKVVCAIGLLLLGIPQGVNNIITYAMIGDTVDYLEWKTGERGEGICFAMQTLINKIGMAVGAFIGILALHIGDIDTKTYTVGNAKALWTVLILSGVISMFACAVPMFFYTITEKRQKEMVAEIAARKSK